MATDRIYPRPARRKGSTSGARRTEGGGKSAAQRRSEGAYKRRAAAELRGPRDPSPRDRAEAFNRSARSSKPVFTSSPSSSSSSSSGGTSPKPASRGPSGPSGPSLGSALGVVGPTHYVGALAVEYVACMLMVGMTPFFASESTANPGQAGTHAHVLLRLTAITLVFMVLGMLSNGRSSGKIAAAFGLLVTLGVAFHSTTEMQWISAHVGVKQNG